MCANMEELIGGSTRFKKLSDDNLHVRNQKIVFILSPCDLDHFIEDEDPHDNSLDIRTWERGDQNARVVIGLSLSDDYLRDGRHFQTDKEMWNELINVFQRQTLLNKLSPRFRFYTVLTMNNEKLLTYLNGATEMASTLKSLSFEIDGKEIAIAVLNGLPS